ncbi:MAG: thermonuclease family protein [Allorhizobium sp.]
MSTAAAGKRNRRKRRAPARKQGQKSLWPWLAALVIVAAGVSAYDNRKHLPDLLADVLAASPSQKPAPYRTPAASPAQARSASVPTTVKTPVVSVKAVIPDERPQTDRLVGRGYAGKFYLCGTSGLDNCVVDGDTFWHHKTSIRIPGIEAPQTEQAKCQRERERGYAATLRLRDWLNAGAFDLAALKGADDGRAGRRLRVVSRNGRSIGDILVSEGLARPSGGGASPWC